MQIITSWDDGNELDFKIVELLNKYKLPGIFYIPTNSQIWPKDILNIYLQGFEIGGHTQDHPENLRLLPPEVQREQMMLNKVWLEDITKTPIEHFCYPSGRFDDTTVAIAAECGFSSARTTLVGNTERPLDAMKIKTTVHVRPDRKEYQGERFLAYAIGKYNEAQRKGVNGYFHVWGHSQEVEEFKMWDQLKALFDYMAENKI